MNETNYFPTLGAAVDEIVERLLRDDIILEPSQGNPLQIVSADLGPVNYGCTVSRGYPIALLKGKNTRRYYHVVIYRLDSGNYELTTYTL